MCSSQIIKLYDVIKLDGMERKNESLWKTPLV
jgi:hypothetical protein